MPFLQEGVDASVVIPAGQSIRVGALAAAVANITIPAGLRGSPITTVTNSSQVLGPYPAGATVSVFATKGNVEYVVGTAPTLTRQLFNPNALVSIAINGATQTTLVNPSIQAVNSANNYMQIANQNRSATALSSADFIAYPDNNSTDVNGFVDIGVTSSAFADPSYTITGQNDAYVFGSAVAGASKTGNLVICTDSTGTSNAIVFGTAGFLAVNERMRLKSGGQLNFTPLAAAPVTNVSPGDIYYNSTLGKLQIRTAATWETITSA